MQPHHVDVFQKKFDILQNRVPGSGISSNNVAGVDRARFCSESGELGKHVKSLVGRNLETGGS